MISSNIEIKNSKKYNFNEITKLMNIYFAMRDLWLRINVLDPEKDPLDIEGGR